MEWNFVSVTALSRLSTLSLVACTQHRSLAVTINPRQHYLLRKLLSELIDEIQPVDNVPKWLYIRFVCTKSSPRAIYKGIEVGFPVTL